MPKIKYADDHDVVMVFCPYCFERNDIEVPHPKGVLEYYQLENIPEKVSKHLDTKKIKCESCKRRFTVKRQDKNIRDTYKLERV